jgi:hypothetical protein
MFINMLTALSLLLCLATVALWVQSYLAIHQIATVAPLHASGVVWWDGTLYIYSALAFQGEFAPVGMRVRGPVDDALDPSSRWPYGFPLGNSNHDVWFDREMHGKVWRGIELPLPRLAWIFGLYPLGRVIDRGLIRMRRQLDDRRRARSGRPLCRSCSYDLTGNISGVCPECGKSIQKPV